jgi:hypothetical protein
MTASTVRKRWVVSALQAGLVAGALDILFAITLHGARGVAPERVLQAVASGVLGRAAFEGGATTAALGLLLHFGIAGAAAAIYFAVARQLRWLAIHPVPAGLAFGLAVYAVMSFLVVPWSAFPGTPDRTPTGVAWQLGAHLLLVGLPIALLARRALRNAASFA